MLVQVSTPRPLVTMTSFPESVVILTLRRDGVSQGIVSVAGGGIVQGGQGSPNQDGYLPLERTRAVPLLNREGNEVLEYVVPFDQMIDRLGRRLATAGVWVLARSAVRLPGDRYEEQALTFWVASPIDGGGIIRILGDYDLANPTFLPNAPPPVIGHYDEEVRDERTERMADENIRRAFERVHTSAASTSAVQELERRRQMRIATFGESLQFVSEEEQRLGEVAADNAVADERMNQSLRRNPAPPRPTREERILSDDD